MTDRIVYHKSELYYYKEGIGSKTILLFHGFGQDHSAFDSWDENLRSDYTIYSFDLYFHGNSKWANQQAITKDDWRKIVELFLEQEKIDQFEIAGFSIGAKFVLTTLLLFPERINKIILLAPDGIKNNFWYLLATGTSLMRGLFRNVVLKPKRIHSLINFLRLLHIEDIRLLRFAESQLSTQEKRQRVYNSWIYFRHLNFDLNALAQVINARNIPVIFVLGKLDRVISAEPVKKFAEATNKHQFHLINATHQDLIGEGIRYAR
jgi:pimeloyl-ACP methyl ester carboxylesterase